MYNKEAPPYVKKVNSTLTMKKFIFAIFSILPFTSISGVNRTLDDTALAILKGSAEFSIDNFSLTSFSENVKTEHNLPDPQLDGEYLVAPTNEDNRWAAELSWGLEWPGVYRQRGRESDLKIEAAKRNLMLKRVERLAEIRMLLLDYILCKKKLLILDDLALNNDSIYHLSEKAGERGEMTMLDINKVRLEYANIRAAKAGILNEEADIIASLSAIYNEDCSQLLSELKCDFPDIYIPTENDLSEISNRAPAIETAMAEADIVRQTRKVSVMEALPNISFGYKHAYEDGIHFNGATLGISVPIFSSAGKQKAAKAAIAESDLRIEAAKSATDTEIKALYNKLSLLKTQLDEIEPIVRRSDSNSLLLKAYREGLITIIDYLTERNYFTSAELEILSLHHAAAIAQTQLQKYMQLPEL